MSVANYALCSLEEVKDFYGMQGSVADDDELLEDLINRTSVLFANECGVDQFKQKNYTEYYDGPGCRYLFVKQVPIISVTELYEDSGWEWAAAGLIDPTDYRVVDSKYIVSKTGFATYDQSIKIVYVAGFDTIPGDLKQVCIEEVIRRYKHRKDFEVLRKTLNDGTAEYVTEPLLGSTFAVLAKYKSGFIA